ncbi:AAA domain-containing protein [Vibrio chagasii]|nr:AAA domain-containing protein [Vibrio chagasii]CAH7126307.1 AAA domain-containing protein [Vibrio chagasii]CAH7141452.1 AAA domain-containing protein [Vibrio chagasii]CAH7331504.1 AAA domain-containing protein [Vibrio chagasii]
MKRDSKIRALEQSSRKGNVSSSYELFNIYEIGAGTDIDLEKSKNYYLTCVDALDFDSFVDGERPNNRIILNDLKLMNFRKFENLDVVFEDDITVIIGNNGSGKTTILESIAKTFSWLNARMVFKGRSGKSLEDSDVTIGVLDNSEVITSINFGNSTVYSGSLVRPAKGIESSKVSELDSYNRLSSLYRVISDRERRTHNDINIPLLAYYSVDRSNMKGNQSFDLEKVTDTVNESKFDAIDKSVLDGTGNLTDFLVWFIYIDNKTDSSLQTKYDALSAEIEALNEVVDGKGNVLWPILEAKKIELEVLFSKIKASKSMQTSNLKEYVKKAIVDAVPSVSDIFVDRSSGRAEVKIVNDNVPVNIYQASKGQQVYLSLVADIARRLILLNPKLKNPLHGQGVVLIDEIELHLHPKWQQDIASNLISTFPNVQFIITTHSPQVLSRLSRTKVRSIGENLDGEEVAVPPLAESYARSASTILSTVMHFDSKQKLPESALLKKYANIIEQGDFRSDEAKSLYAQLRASLGEDHEELVRLSLVLRRREKLE